MSLQRVSQLILFLIHFFFAMGLTAQSTSIADANVQDVVDLTQILGLLPTESYELLGAPQEVLASRLNNDVVQLVHYYADHIYLFWFRNRIWQLRLDQRFKGTFMGLKMGMLREQVENLIGQPRFKDEDWYTYELPVLGFPRRLRLKFNNNLLSDLYYFRSDL